MIILAIDSGIEKTGYAIFKDSKYITSGLIKTSKLTKKQKRLEDIYLKTQAIIKKYRPKIIILEQLFFFKNQKTAIGVSQTQGALLLLAAQHNINIEFLTPLQIKQIITGYGQADKKSVQKMVNLILKLPHGKVLKQDDEADAVACGLAYCYLHKNLLQ